jgi:hypothetical protein
MSTICSPFSSWFIASDFSLVLNVFHQFFTCIALGDADLCFSLLLVRRANAVEEKTNEPHDDITSIISLYT